MKDKQISKRRICCTDLIASKSGSCFGSSDDHACRMVPFWDYKSRPLCTPQSQWNLQQNSVGGGYSLIKSLKSVKFKFSFATSLPERKDCLRLCHKLERPIRCRMLGHLWRNRFLGAHTCERKMGKEQNHGLLIFVFTQGYVFQSFGVFG